jgi:hypothetical protein
VIGEIDASRVIHPRIVIFGLSTGQYLLCCIRPGRMGFTKRGRGESRTLNGRGCVGKISGCGVWGSECPTRRMDRRGVVGEVLSRATY